DKMIVDFAEAIEPECRQLVQDRALLRDRVRQDDVERRESIGRDEQKRVAKIEHFANLAAAQLFNSGKINGCLRCRFHKENVKGDLPFTDHRSLITLQYGRNSRQTSGADPSWTRLGLLQRSLKDFWKPSRRRRHFA